MDHARSHLTHGYTCLVMSFLTISDAGSWWLCHQEAMSDMGGVIYSQTEGKDHIQASVHVQGKSPVINQSD